MRAVLLLAVFAVVLSSASAWWCMGHMLVANIAMKSVSKTTLARVNDLIDMVAPWYPESPDFTQAGCWADDLKAEDVNQYDDWHFINLPYVNGAIEFQIDRVATSNNVIWAINQAVTTLNGTYSKDINRALMLRFLIHFVGDMHQPLHIMTQFSYLFPAPGGDMGGNIYIIHGVNITDLHGYYDSGAEQWYADPARPLSPTNASVVSNTADALMKEFPPSAFAGNLSVHVVDDWALDTYNRYADFVYSIPNNGTLTSAYETAAQLLCRSQVTLAGYRLAAVLDAIFDPQSEIDAIQIVKHLRGSRARLDARASHL